MSERRRPAPPSEPRPGAQASPMPVAEVVERLKLDRRPSSQPTPPRGHLGQLLTGRLQEHGRATYQFRPDASPSYYVKIISTRGVETLWGVDLERALTHSKTQPKIGALVGIQRTGSDRVTIPAGQGDRKTDLQRTFRRVRWIVEDIAYFAESIEQARRELKSRLEDKRAMTERPELRSAFISLRVAQQYAERHIRDPHDRELFITRVKAVMAASVRSGKPVPEPRLVERGRVPPNRDDPAR